MTWDAKVSGFGTTTVNPFPRINIGTRTNLITGTTRSTAWLWRTPRESTDGTTLTAPSWPTLCAKEHPLKNPPWSNQKYRCFVRKKRDVLRGTNACSQVAISSADH